MNRKKYFRIKFTFGKKYYILQINVLIHAYHETRISKDDHILAVVRIDSTSLIAQVGKASLCLAEKRKNKREEREES
jgi:hypothetical protein